MANISTIVKTMLSAVTATGAGAAVSGVSSYKTFQAKGATTAGAGAATVVVQGSNDDGASWDTVGTISLTLSTTSTSDSFTDTSRYGSYRGNVTALSGTGANVTLSMGY